MIVNSLCDDVGSGVHVYFAQHRLVVEVIRYSSVQQHCVLIHVYAVQISVPNATHSVTSHTTFDDGRWYFISGSQSSFYFYQLALIAST